MTKDEEANIGRTLESLRWASRVVVVDSGSVDRTAEIARTFPNVAWFVRPWTSFGDQWRFALQETGVDTAWMLALDADMQTPAPLVDELAALARDETLDGAYLGFDYAVGGTRLAGSFYPPQLRFLRRANAWVYERGHTQEFRVGGRTVRAGQRLLHDDRKPVERFIAAQVGYSRRERDMLLGEVRPFALRNALRLHMPFLPEIVGLAAYLRAGGPFRGAAARRYGLERLLFEAMLRYRILEARQSGRANPPS